MKCACCPEGHALAVVELVVRRQRDGEVIKRLVPVPGGFRDVTTRRAA